MSGSKDFSVPDLAPADRKIQMTAKENKFHSSVKYVIFFLRYYAIQSDVRATVC